MLALQVFSESVLEDRHLQVVACAWSELTLARELDNKRPLVVCCDLRFVGNHPSIELFSHIQELFIENWLLILNISLGLCRLIITITSFLL